MDTICATAIPRLVDLAIDQKARNARGLCLLNRLDRSVRSGVVENDRDRFAGDRRVDQLVLLVGVVVVDEHQSVVAERLGFCGRPFASVAKNGLSCEGVMIAIKPAA